eukprot:CAMPEP_0197440414 /NCGR_PEP_ID=MMETSP1175-20131217/6930_1 /TAXON_ID=1003142 /ORGANISM="Triceratium dubium, Strain CCMP147" /LENGTH=145 /DNA_ID=CAMNT_0042970513 /DNA_START=959 /DNA_END=1393 /DNA_ORIENTATION=+
MGPQTVASPAHICTSTDGKKGGAQRARPHRPTGPQPRPDQGRERMYGPGRPDAPFDEEFSLRTVRTVCRTVVQCVQWAPPVENRSRVRQKEKTGMCALVVSRLAQGGGDRRRSTPTAAAAGRTGGRKGTETPQEQNPLLSFLPFL